MSSKMTSQEIDYIQLWDFIEGSRHPPTKQDLVDKGGAFFAFREVMSTKSNTRVDYFEEN